MGEKIQKVTFLTIKKGGELYFILIMEDKRVFLNFGDDNWFNVRELDNLKQLKDKRKYQQYLRSKKFKKNIAETIEIMDNSKDYEEITQKFIKDFKKDRGNKIIRNDAEIDTTKSIEDIEYEFKK
ncbi:MAG TPA: hypothetical protein VJ912_00615 [Candidatus Nanoarchaeia archaeon]|nr:hypothetical protein [Candidatus Nanoarchaeia archaeon]